MTQLSAHFTSAEFECRCHQTLAGCKGYLALPQLLAGLEALWLVTVFVVAVSAVDYIRQGIKLLNLAASPAAPLKIPPGERER